MTRLVSVIVPCRNECAHVDTFLDGVSAQCLPLGWAMEVLVADGASDDGTHERLRSRARVEARLRVIDNPARIVSTGLNACLARAGGEIIARLDVHTTYAPDYLAQCIATLERTGADNVGGPWVAQGEAPLQRAIAAAFQSPWVVGGARSRDIRYEGAVDSVYLGCWPRATFDRHGLFDELLVRNQDDEHNLRIRRGGGRVWQSATIRSTYRPRASLAHLLAQQWQYGYWRTRVLRKHGTRAPVRQWVPAAFVGALAGAALAWPWTGPLPLAALLSVYGLYLAATSALIAQRVEPALWWRLPAVVATYQLAYGAGTWRGAIDLWRRGAAPPSALGLTR